MHLIFFVVSNDLFTIASGLFSRAIEKSILKDTFIFYITFISSTEIFEYSISTELIVNCVSLVNFVFNIGIIWLLKMVNINDWISDGSAEYHELFLNDSSVFIGKLIAVHLSGNEAA